METHVLFTILSSLSISTTQYNGAITIQRLVDDFIINDSGAKAAGWSVASNGVTFAPFPSRKYTDDGFYAAIARKLVRCFLMSVEFIQ
jgi:glycopeptide antibiotics resistance protein